MTFDEHGHLHISPRQLLQLAHSGPRLLADHYLIHPTPIAFGSYPAYCEFLHEISRRIGVHPRNLFLRGSCQLGFSITPRVEKAWMAMDDQSDLDLAIVDAAYFERIDQEVIRWEERTRAHRVQGPASERFEDRQRDRFYNCCRVDYLPAHLCAHHGEAMKDVARMEHCGRYRRLNAFIFRDWFSLRSRYLFDLKDLTDRVPRTLTEPGEEPLPRIR